LRLFAVLCVFCVFLSLCLFGANSRPEPSSKRQNLWRLSAIQLMANRTMANINVGRSRPTQVKRLLRAIGGLPRMLDAEYGDGRPQPFSGG
jgi:predicted metal-dependent enzyme (double-stranded beta helix superfamily)